MRESKNGFTQSGPGLSLPFLLVMILAISFFILITFTMNSCKARPQMPDLYFETFGEGQPTIILDTGFGETFESWDQLLPKLAELSQVFVYERAGYGQSKPGRFPRSARMVAHELEYTLRNNGIKPPYLLIGHSLGAMNMQVFAHDHPELVAGMILMDPPPQDWLEGRGFPELRELADTMSWEMNETAIALLASDDPDEQREGMFYKTLASEHNEMLNSSARQIGRIESFGYLPLTVIGAGQPNPAFRQWASSYQAYWITTSQMVASKSTRGEFILADQSSHHIHHDAPEIVLEAVKDLITLITSTNGYK